MHAHNPYVAHLQQFHHIPHTATTALELSESSSNNDFAAIMHAANSTSVRPRNILIWRNSDQEPTFVPIYSRHYEPLQYPLLFPHGTLGWGLTADDPSCPDNLTRPFDFTQRQWYKSRLLTEDRFLHFGRVASEYIVDMYSRIEEERLGYIRRNRVSHAQLSAPEGQQDEIPNIELPTSFIGSRRWASEETADSLALARAFDRPSYFITMTCNPDWPEIRARLRPDQTAADAPVVTARAFKLRLQRLLDIIRKRLGEVKYIIKIVEFQKRGLPHAHIIIKVRITHV